MAWQRSPCVVSWQHLRFRDAKPPKLEALYSCTLLQNIKTLFGRHYRSMGILRRVNRDEDPLLAHNPVHSFLRSQAVGAVTSVDLTMDGMYLLASSRHGPVRTWDVRMGRPLLRYKVRGLSISCPEVRTCLRSASRCCCWWAAVLTVVQRCKITGDGSRAEVSFGVTRAHASAAGECFAVAITNNLARSAFLFARPLDSFVGTVVITMATML